MKNTLTIILIILVGLLGLTVFGGYRVWRGVGDLSFANLVNYFGGAAKIEIDQDMKEKLKEEARDLEDRIYNEATEHNPEGDLIPDEWDDKLKKKIKEEAKERLLEKGKEATEEAVDDEMNKIIKEDEN